MKIRTTTPKTWKQFALALGADEKEIETKDQDSYTKDMIDNFFKQARSKGEGSDLFILMKGKFLKLLYVKLQD